MAGRRARCRPALSCFNEFKLTKQRANDNKNHSASKLIKKKKMESWNINEVEFEPVMDASWNCSVLLVDYLHSVLPPQEHMLIHETLVRLLLRTDGTLRAQVVEYARRQLMLTCDICEPIVWTGLNAPVVEYVRQKTSYSLRVSQLRSRHYVHFSSFVVRVPRPLQETIACTDFWPKGVVFRRFRGNLPNPLYEMTTNWSHADLKSPK